MSKKLFKQEKRKKKETKRNRIKRNKTKNKLKRNKTKRRTNLDLKGGLPPFKTALTLATLGAISATPLGVGTAVAAGTFGGAAGIIGASIYNNNKTKNNQPQQDLEEFKPMIQVEGRAEEEDYDKGVEDEDEDEGISHRRTQTLPAETIEEIIEISYTISQGGEKLIKSVLENIESYIEGTMDFTKLKNIMFNLDWSIITSAGALAISRFQEPIIEFLNNIKVHERLQVLRELSTRLKKLGGSESGKEARRMASGPIKQDGGGNKIKRRKSKRR